MSIFKKAIEDGVNKGLDSALPRFTDSVIGPAIRDGLKKYVAPVIAGWQRRVHELEDAITEAGIILSEASREDNPDDPREMIKRAMRQLDKVMQDPKIMKRQGI